MQSELKNKLKESELIKLLIEKLDTEKHGNKG